MGAGVVLTGFPPFVNLPARLHVTSLVGFAALTPAALTVYLAYWAARHETTASRARLPITVRAGLALLLAGAALSLLQSSRPTDSLSLGLLGIVLPIALFLCLRRAALPPALLAGGFFAALAAMLLRADFAFIREYGLPTARTLFNAKFANRAYDFHYYTLGNPNHSSAFLLLPLAAAVYWASERSTARRTRVWLSLFAGLVFITLVLLYERFPLLVASVVVVAPVLRRGVPRAVKVAIVAAAIVALAVLVVSSPHQYFSDVFSLGSVSSPGKPIPTSGAVRVASVAGGYHTFLQHPLTGVGLGRFGDATTNPAHSGIVQAAAEMGITGALGLVLLVVASTLGIVRALRGRPGPLLGAAGYACGVYGLFVTVAGGAPEGLFVGTVSVYGLAFAMFGAIALPASEPSASEPIGVAWRATVKAIRTYTANRLARLARALGWLAYGILWIPVTLSTFSGVPSSQLLSSTREVGYAQLLAAHAQGLGPLVQMLGPNQFAPAGISDDQGGYLFAPWLATIFGRHTIDGIVRASFLASVMFLVAIYPLLFRRLFASRAAGAAAPLIVLLSLGFLTDDGFYWVPAVAFLVALPWLLILVRARSLPLAAALALTTIAALTSLFRAQTGLAIVIGFIIIAIFAQGSRRRRTVTVLLVLVAYYALTTGVLDLAYQSRAHRMQSYPVNTGGVADVTDWSQPSGHPFWHAAYLGLSVVPNRWGIVWNDTVAANYVKRIDPFAPYLSARYEAVLRSHFIHIAEQDPGLIVRAYAKKSEWVLRDGLVKFPVLLVLVPLALAAGAARRRRRAVCGVGASLLVVAVAPSLMTIPSPDYEQPWLGLLAAVTAVCTGYLLARVTRPLAPAGDLVVAGGARVLRRAVLPVEQAGRWIGAVFAATSPGRDIARTRAGAALRSRNGQRRIALTVVAVLIGLIARHELLLSVGSPVVSSVASDVGSPLAPVNERYSPLLVGWTMRGIPTGWRADAAVVNGRQARTASTNGGLMVWTSPGRYAYELDGPKVTLRPGSYIAVVRGRVEQGGLGLGALDVRSDAWIGEVLFPAAQRKPVSMPLSFSINRPTLVQLIVMNYRRRDLSSTWTLSRVLIAGPNATAVAQPPPSRTSALLPAPASRLTSRVSSP